MDDEIEEYLRNQGIVRRDARDVKMILTGKNGGKSISDVLGNDLEGVPLVNLPEYYDIMQCYFPFYESRLGFLGSLLRFLNDVDLSEGSTVIDAGCATGIDSCLVQRYTGLEVIGYDFNEGMIDLALKRNEILKIGSDFIVAKHSDNSLLDVADILYTRQIGYPAKKMEDFCNVARIIRKKIKRNGYYVMGSETVRVSEKYITLMAEVGFRHIKSELTYSDMMFALREYNHFFIRE